MHTDEEYWTAHLEEAYERGLVEISGFTKEGEPIWKVTKKGEELMK